MIELMVVIAVVAILAAVATPSFSKFVLGQRVKTASFDMASTLLLARSEAIKRNTNVTIAPNDASNWAGGWKVTLVATGGAVVTLSEQTAYSGLTIGVPSSLASLIYAGSSGRPSAGIKFQLSGADTTRCVTVDVSGVTSTKTGACT